MGLSVYAPKAFLFKIHFTRWPTSKHTGETEYWPFLMANTNEAAHRFPVDIETPEHASVGLFFPRSAATLFLYIHCAKDSSHLCRGRYSAANPINWKISMDAARFWVFFVVVELDPLIIGCREYLMICIHFPLIWAFSYRFFTLKISSISPMQMFRWLKCFKLHRTKNLIFQSC